MYKDLAKQLKKNTMVMEKTFSLNNLEVLQFSFAPYSEDDADCRLYIEVASKSENMLDDNISIKVNLYDEYGEIIFADEEFIPGEEFQGYNTYIFDLCSDGKMLQMAKQARIYAVKD